jgi:hypothetical protein
MRLCVLGAAVAIVPASAHAETYFNPWAGLFFGNDKPTVQGPDKSLTSFGGDIGDTGSKVGGELSFGYTPSFFGKGGVDNYVLDLMGGATGGPQFGRSNYSVRPYGAGGVGLLRTSIGDTSKNNFGFNAGGGVFIYFSENIGVRVDLRYFRTINGEDLGDFHFTRAQFGLLIR